MDEWTRKKKNRNSDEGRGKPAYIPHKATWLTALLICGIVALIVGRKKLLLLGPLLLGLGAVFLALLSLLVGGGLLWAYFLFQGWKSRLVLDEVGLSLQRDKDGVIGHIPYANIASAEVSKRFQGGGDDIFHGRSEPMAEWNVLEITLVKYNCPDTFWPKMESEGRCDIELKDEYTRDLSFIRAKILEGVRAYRDQKGYKNLG